MLPSASFFVVQVSAAAWRRVSRNVVAFMLESQLKHSDLFRKSRHVFCIASFDV